MRVFRTLDSIEAPKPGWAVAIGNFDGLHRGHRRIVRRLRREAATAGLPVCLLTFTPHPEKIFSPDRILMIQTLDQRLRGLCRMGLETAVVLPFSRSLARMTAEEFAASVLAGAMNARLVVVGADFRFGSKRRGDAAFLGDAGRLLGFRTVVVPPLVYGGSEVSSSRVRTALAAGNVEDAARLLGRAYEIEGEVVQGSGRGRIIGFPTANLHSPNEILPPGVYATRLFRKKRAWKAVTNIGLRPTFGELEPTIETHVLGVSPDLYGAYIRLAFLSRLRNERTFRGPAALAGGIRADIAAARRVFRRLGL
ncbi:MAG: riboflavin biosynthesis protein RibF [Candidatus Aminicenantes bacterium]|nr:riboflavin biosynthesis protein RibF [Candidatus Aminicenantes bacterium]